MSDQGNFDLRTRTEEQRLKHPSAMGQKKNQKWVTHSVWAESAVDGEVSLNLKTHGDGGSGGKDRFSRFCVMFMFSEYE